METGSNKSLFTLLAVVIFGLFLSLSYWLFQDEMKSVLADVMDKTSEMNNTKLNNNGLIPTDQKYFTTTTFINSTTGLEEIRLTSYTGNLAGITDVVIPSEINGIKVTTIAQGTFYNKGLTSVVMPYSLTTIEGGSYGSTAGYQGAFANNKLRVVNIPDSITYIGTCAFRASGIEELNLGNGLLSMGSEVFAFNKIENLELPDSLLVLNHYTFAGNRIKTVHFGDKITTIETNALRGNQFVELTIPETVTKIGLFNFAQNTKLTKVNLPSHLKALIASKQDILTKTLHDNSSGITIADSYYDATTLLNYY